MKQKEAQSFENTKDLKNKFCANKCYNACISPHLDTGGMCQSPPHVMTAPRSPWRQPGDQTRGAMCLGRLLRRYEQQVLGHLEKNISFVLS